MIDGWVGRLVVFWPFCGLPSRKARTTQVCISEFKQVEYPHLICGDTISHNGLRSKSNWKGHQPKSNWKGHQLPSIMGLFYTYWWRSGYSKGLIGRSNGIDCLRNPFTTLFCWKEWWVVVGTRMGLSFKDGAFFSGSSFLLWCSMSTSPPVLSALQESQFRTFSSPGSKGWI